MTLPEIFRCPKSMEYGPCAGVQDDGRCEVAEHQCVFLDRAPREWAGIMSTTGPAVKPPRAPLVPQSAAMQSLLGQRQIVVSDFPIRAARRADVAAGALALRDSVDAVLIGEPPSIRVQFPPAYRTQLLRAMGVTVWSSVNCRDRNRVAIEGELAALVDAGVSLVHCITGDHTLLGRRPEAMPVFDLDSTELTALATARGLLTSVAESAEAEPRNLRPARFVQKVAAGADLAFMNINSGPEVVDGFLGRVRELGVQRRAMVCVPFLIDEGSARIMTGLSTHVLPPGYVESVLGAPDPRAAGIRAAADLARRYLDVKGVAGVCLSGGASQGGELAYAEAMAETADRIGLR